MIAFSGPRKIFPGSGSLEDGPTGAPTPLDGPALSGPAPSVAGLQSVQIALPERSFLFNKGDGFKIIDLGAQPAEIVLGRTIAPSEVLMQVDSSGDLTIFLRDDPADVLFLKGDIYSAHPGVGSYATIVFADGTALSFDPLVGPTSTWIAPAPGRGPGPALIGSGFGPNVFYLGAGGDQVTLGNGLDGGVNLNTIYFDKGDGEASIDVNAGRGSIVLGPDIGKGELLFQADNSGNLRVFLNDDPADGLMLQGELYQYSYGVGAYLGSIVLSDGTVIDLDRRTGPTSTWIAAPRSSGSGQPPVPLIGSGFGANRFYLGAGGNQVTLGNGDHGGVNSNTIYFDKGDGYTAVTLDGGRGGIVVGADVPAANVYLQADDGTGDLTVLLAAGPPGAPPADAVVLQKDLSATGGFPTGRTVISQLSSIRLGDGSVIDLNAASGLTFTWYGPAPSGYGTRPTLVGSGFGANVFYLAPGGDQVTLGNGSKGGADRNTIHFDKGDGPATIVVDGGQGSVVMGTGIAASDVLVHADDSGGLTILLRGDTADSLSIAGDLFYSDPFPFDRMVESSITGIQLADGSTIVLNTPSGPTSTWVGTTNDTHLVGSGYGPNVFELGAGGDHVILGNGDLGGANRNTIDFDKGDGIATVDVNGGYGKVVLGADIAASDVLVQGDNTGDLTIALRDDTVDAITFQNALLSEPPGIRSFISSIALGDGSSIDLTSPSGPTFTYPAVPSGTLTGSSFGINVFDMTNLSAFQDSIAFFNPVQDIIRFSDADFSSYGTVQSHESTVTYGTLITSDRGNSVLVESTNAAQLSAQNFQFV